MNFIKLFENFDGMSKDEVIDILLYRCLAELLDNNYSYTIEMDYPHECDISIKIVGDSSEYGIVIILKSEVYIDNKEYLDNQLVNNIKHFFNKNNYVVDSDTVFIPIMNPNNFELVRRLKFLLKKK